MTASRETFASQGIGVSDYAAFDRKRTPEIPSPILFWIRPKRKPGEGITSLSLRSAGMRFQHGYDESPGPMHRISPRTTEAVVLARHGSGFLAVRMASRPGGSISGGGNGTVSHERIVFCSNKWNNIPIYMKIVL